MDGIDNPPFFRKFVTSKLNALLDGIYIVPRRIGEVARLPAARPRKEQIYFIGATNVPVDRLNWRSRGRAAWGATSGSARRRSRTASTSSTSTSKVAHAPELDQPARREEIARVTNG